MDDYRRRMKEKILLTVLAVSCTILLQAVLHFGSRRASFFIILTALITADAGCAFLLGRTVWKKNGNTRNFTRNTQDNWNRRAMILITAVTLVVCTIFTVSYIRDIPHLSHPAEMTLTDTGLSSRIGTRFRHYKITGTDDRGRIIHMEIDADPHRKAEKLLAAGKCPVSVTITYLPHSKYQLAVETQAE